MNVRKFCLDLVRGEKKNASKNRLQQIAYKSVRKVVVPVNIKRLGNEQVLALAYQIWNVSEHLLSVNSILSTFLFYFE